MFHKRRGQKGFTLVEMLIVVAIIAILIAIAIPVYTAQMDKAKVAVDDANLRSAQSLAIADYMLNGDTDGATYTFANSANNELTISTGTDLIDPQSSTHTGTIVVVIAADGSITSASWTTAP